MFKKTNLFVFLSVFFVVHMIFSLETTINNRLAVSQTVMACEVNEQKGTKAECAGTTGLELNNQGIQPELAGPKQSSQTPLPFMSGMIVVRDPETGQLRAPTADEAIELNLRAGLNRSSDGLQPETYPDGTVGVNLQGRFMNYSIAKIDKDGSIKSTCVTNSEDAVKFLNTTGQSTKEAAHTK